VNVDNYASTALYTQMSRKETRTQSQNFRSILNSTVNVTLVLHLLHTKCNDSLVLHMKYKKYVAIFIISPLLHHRNTNVIWNSRNWDTIIFLFATVKQRIMCTKCK